MNSCAKVRKSSRSAKTICLYVILLTDKVGIGQYGTLKKEMINQASLGDLASLDILHSRPDNGSLEPKRYKVDFLFH